MLLELLQSLWSYPASLRDTQNAVTQKETYIKSNKQAIRNKLAIGSLLREKTNPITKQQQNPTILFTSKLSEAVYVLTSIFFSTQLVTVP